MPQRNESTRSRARIHAKLFAATLPWGDAAIAALCSDHEGALLTLREALCAYGRPRSDIGSHGAVRQRQTDSLADRSTGT